MDVQAEATPQVDVAEANCGSEVHLPGPGLVSMSDHSRRPLPHGPHTGVRCLGTRV